MLGDHESAILSYEAAHEADPENEDSAMPLINEYVEKQKYEAAEPLLDLLIRKSGKRERAEQHDLQNKLGLVCAALGKDEKALKSVRRQPTGRSISTHQATIRAKPRRGLLPSLKD